jgi:hypothetical protein
MWQLCNGAASIRSEGPDCEAKAGTLRLAGYVAATCTRADMVSCLEECVPVPPTKRLARPKHRGVKQMFSIQTLAAWRRPCGCLRGGR